MKNTLKHPRDYRAKRLALALQLCSIFAACATYAGVAVKWTAETSRVHPEIIEAWRGDTLDLACTLKSYGQTVSLGAATASFLWQTNGMGNAWWQTNATVSAGGVIRATWSPAMDPGAGEVAFFMPVQSAGGASYRAAGRIRFRPSPGAGSQIIDLPQPGGTLDFGAYQLVNAPWATLDAVNSAIDANNALIDSAISSATGALVIPPAVDLGLYATTGMVFAAVQTSSNGLANAIQVAFTAASNRTDAVAADLAAEISSTSNGLRSVLRDTIAESTTASRAYSDAAASNAQRAAIAAIPSLTGYATEQYVGDAIAAIELPSLDGYATTAYANAAASNAQATAIAAIPSLAGYATEQYVGDAIAAIELPSLDGYATTAYADAAASNAQATAIAAIPSLTGYATQQYVGDAIAAIELPSLDGYATTAYADAAASNAQAAAMAAIPSLAGYATETYAQNAAASAASDALNAAQSYARDLSWAASEGNTRLVSTDGTTWQDATGTVWQVTNVYGWAGTVIDLASSTARPIVFTYYGTTTNAPNTGGEETKYWSAGGGTNLFFDAEMADRWTIWFENGYGDYTPPVYFHADGDPPPPSTATNLTFTTSIEFYSLSYQPVALATNPVDRVLYESSGGGGGGEPGNYAAVSNNSMKAVLKAQATDTERGETVVCDFVGDPYFIKFVFPDAKSTFDWLFVNDTGETSGTVASRAWAQDAIAFAATAATNYTDWAIQNIDPPIPMFDVYAADVTNVADFVTSNAISTNNAAFVEAVLAAPIAGAAPSDLAEIGEYGSYGTVGAAILALIAGLAALKRRMGTAETAISGLSPKYPMVPVTPSGGTLTVSPYTVATYTADDSAASFEVAVGTGTAGVARDCELVIDCTATGAVAPTVTWPAMFHPRTDAATDFACEAGKRNVYFISEYASGEFAVGGWQETAGGNAS